MSDLRGRQLLQEYQNLITKGSGPTPLEDGNGAAYFYEEGTWTPTDESGAGLTVSETEKYVLIGNTCFLFFSFRFPVTSNTNTAQIGGLPVAFTDLNDLMGYLVRYEAGGSISLEGRIGPNSFIFRNTVADTELTNADLSNILIRGHITILAS